MLSKSKIFKGKEPHAPFGGNSAEQQMSQNLFLFGGNFLLLVLFLAYKPVETKHQFISEHWHVMISTTHKNIRNSFFNNFTFRGAFLIQAY